MPAAARVSDNTSHGNPLGPGPGSMTVKIGMMNAWRALPSSVGGAVESASKTTNSFMTKPVLTPPSAASDLAQIVSGLGQAAGAAAGAGNPGAIGPCISGCVTVMTTNVALTTAWSTASVAPGGQPAANEAYTKGITAAVGAAAAAVFSAIGGMTDMHVCPIPTPIPPHGPGMVCKASGTVLIDNLPACRMNDQVMEACGGADPIAKGDATVDIGD